MKWGPWIEAVEPYCDDRHDRPQQVKLRDGTILSVGFLNFEGNYHSGRYGLDYADVFPSEEIAPDGSPHAEPIVAYRFLVPDDPPMDEQKEKATLFAQRFLFCSGDELDELDEVDSYVINSDGSAAIYFTFDGKLWIAECSGPGSVSVQNLE